MPLSSWNGAVHLAYPPLWHIILLPFAKWGNKKAQLKIATIAYTKNNVDDHDILKFTKKLIGCDVLFYWLEDIAKENGNVIGGFVREPINKTNIYGGISFYSQHGVQTMMELFGMNPRSVQVFEKGIALTCVVRYDDFDVVLSFADLKFSVYYAGISFEDKFEATDISLDGCAEAEFMEFYDVLKTRKQKKSYEEFFAPVYVIDAITRAVESGKEEPIVKYEV